MIYTIAMIAFFTMLLVLKRYKNKYMWIFFFEFLGLAATCFVMLLYVSKLSFYNTNFDIERRALIYLYSWKINFYTISRVFNISCAIFMYSMAVFACIYGNSINLMQSYIRLVVSLIPVLLYLWLNDPETTYIIYLLLNHEDSFVSGGLRVVLSNVLIVYNYIILAVYLIMPLLKLIKIHRSVELSYNKKQILLLSLMFLMLDLFYIMFFVMGPFRDLSNFGMDYLKFNMSYDSYTGYYMYFMPAIVLCILVITAVLVLKFNVVYESEMNQSRFIKKRLKSMNQELYRILHSYKNTLFSIQLLSREGIINSEQSDIKNKFIKIEKNASDSMATISRLLDAFNSVKIECENMDMLECINSAINKLPENNVEITLNIKTKPENCIIYADEIHITEVFVNVFNNSIEAIREKDEENGKIVVEIYNEYNWLCVKVTDNGCGIKKKNYKKIFKPLQSTKNNKNNWGIGLAYVHNVIREHSGIISVKSKYGEYTTIEMLFPCRTSRAD